MVQNQQNTFTPADGGKTSDSGTTDAGKTYSNLISGGWTFSPKKVLFLVRPGAGNDRYILSFYENDVPNTTLCSTSGGPDYGQGSRFVIVQAFVAQGMSPVGQYTLTSGIDSLTVMAGAGAGSTTTFFAEATSGTLSIVGRDDAGTLFGEFSGAGFVDTIDAGVLNPLSGTFNVPPCP